MDEITQAQQARMAIRVIKTTVDALALRGYYKPTGKSGQTLAEGLRLLRPEIYGSMTDTRIIELKGLEYVLDRLPRGIEECTEIVLTAHDDFANTSFEKIEPPKRRRASYRISEKEMCFIITRGLSEIYDIITHITFLNNEAVKISNQMYDLSGDLTREWKDLEKIIQKNDELTEQELERTLWSLSIILGRTYQETRATYDYLEKMRSATNSNKGIFSIVYHMGKRVRDEKLSRDNELLIYFTPSLKEMIGHQKTCKNWARNTKDRLNELGLQNRPLHIVSANLHSVMNLLYGYAALKSAGKADIPDDLYEFSRYMRHHADLIQSFARQHGLYPQVDRAKAFIDCQIIDTSCLGALPLHPRLSIDINRAESAMPLILVMDYAFGTQAFGVMDELLKPYREEESADDTLAKRIDVRSIFIMGKAGILTGRKGDIMLATAHFIEGTADNYIVKNSITREDFDESVKVHVGPIITVLGTSLQNRHVLERLKTTSLRAVGLEMEGGHYQRAINAAIIRNHISKTVKVGYAYYASDNPLISGETLASGSMGDEGIKPTYMITKIILEKIFNDHRSSRDATPPADDE